ncbi:alpha/beta fold hydrolase [Phreatobacter sp.]|uniref:alpha/beta fold hydrolase n=1 Tax=Phreatobacter sp. TaxID=1966341 RepID=UPI0025E37ACB|nr:alpha/beta fold hydrolase [Phreatobacter sp.]
MPLPFWFALFDASLAAAHRTFDSMASLTPGLGERPKPPASWRWSTTSSIVRELPTMRLREFAGTAGGPGMILVAPYALHGATITDLAPGHSVIKALLAAGIGQVWLTEWRSADEAHRHQSIDAQLADLNVAVDDCGAPVAMAGLCQGGTLAAIYAARFPAKILRLVLVGAPIDMAAAPSVLTDMVERTPAAAVDLMLDQWGGLVRGRIMQDLWPSAMTNDGLLAAVLQRRRVPAWLRSRFQEWDAEIVDLPGAFYRDTVNWIFRQNRLVSGTFPALGREIGLGAIACPLLLVAARDDEIVSPPQLLDMASQVASPPDRIAVRLVAGRHLSLFMGKDVLARTWPEIAAFLTERPAAQPKPKARAGRMTRRRASER